MIITSVVPPELPMELSLAVTNSLIALSRLNMFCTEPFRIPYAGRIDICCFDKTGTLTSDDLTLHGVAGLNTTPVELPGHRTTHTEMDLVAPEHLPVSTAVILAGCHSLLLHHGQVLGDPLEVTALQGVQWKMGFSSGRNLSCRMEPSLGSEHHGVMDHITILHRFSFSSELKRMSTIVKMQYRENDKEDEYRLLSKGAPEVLEPLLTSKPVYYSQVYRHFASKGCRVLALGYRTLAVSSIQAVQTLIKSSTRHELESKIVFAGFLVLDSPLKEDTKRTVRDLLVSQHKVVMITGDNALTACNVARQIGIHATFSKELLILTVQSTEKNVEWRGIDDGSQSMEEIKSFPFVVDDVATLQKEYDLCVSGEALTVLLQQQESIVQSDKERAFEAYMKILERLSLYVHVFARTSPQQKEQMVMAMNRAGKITAMCGDGTNDVGALKRAHVGISIVNNPETEQVQRSLVSQLATGRDARDTAARRLSKQLQAMQEEEARGGMVRLGDASIASPFTTKSSSIRIIKALVRQGRCTLVTTIQMYKILGINCLITAYYLSSLYMYGVKNGDQQLTIVGLGIAMFFLFLSRAKAAKRLSSERPPAGVFCIPVLASIIGQSLLHLCFLAAALRMAEPYIDRTDPSMHPDGTFSPNVINSIMFLVSVVMQINTFVVNYKGQPFMESFWENTLLSRSAIVAYSVLVLAVLEVIPWLNEILELVPLPNEQVRQSLAALMVGDTVATVALEYVIYQRLGGM